MDRTYDSIEAKSFFAGLFDTQFSQFITPKIARVLYVLTMVVIVIQVIWVLIFFDRFSAVPSSVLLLFGILYAFVALVLSRVVIELILAIFSAVADLRRLAADDADDADDESQVGGP